MIECPADMRFAPKARLGSEKVQTICHFLEGLYRQAAETLPDCPSNHTSNKRPRQGKYKRDDPHLDRSCIRHLPPGSVMDYLRLLRAEHPNEKFSCKLFASVWGEHFSDKLRIRSASHHSKCALCIRHRLIIKRVGNGPARAAQLKELQKHLRLQYRDRTVYWSCRSSSRFEAASPNCEQVTCILDSMDQQKHCWPRSEAMNSKEFNSWGRPKMSSTTLILHGHGIVTALSPPTTPCNSSRTVEILGAGMTRCVRAGVDWRQTRLVLQADNCSKECKNQTVIRFLAQMVACKRLRGARLQCLMSGHSHEDIDALFSVLSNYIGRFKELPTMNHFQDCLQRFYDQDHVRTHEGRFRKVELLTRYHDWTFGFLLEKYFCTCLSRIQCH